MTQTENNDEAKIDELDFDELIAEAVKKRDEQQQALADARAAFEKAETAEKNARQKKRKYKSQIKKMESNNSTNFTILGYRLNKLIGETDNLLILESWFEEYLQKYQRQILKEYQTYKAKVMSNEATEDDTAAVADNAAEPNQSSNKNNKGQNLNEVTQTQQPSVQPQNSQPNYTERSFKDDYGQRSL